MKDAIKLVAGEASCENCEHFASEAHPVYAYEVKGRVRYHCEHCQRVAA